MKKSITKFDLEAAFKALDELEIPQAEKGIRANRPALNEIFSKKSKLDYLIEEYYDVSNPEELSDAKETKEAEIAKAKLARIEKIVDLDAESPEDLLTSYVGKYIVQCPQCMTLFYKNPEDVEESEDDPETVNVSEVCQHCGNESGYTLIGKVGVVEEEIPDSDDAIDIDLELTDDEIDESEENVDEENVDSNEDEADLDLEEIDLTLEDDEVEEDTQEEAFATATAGELLVEQLTEEAEESETVEDAELDITDAEFASLLQSPEFQKPISNRTAEAMLDKLDEAVQTCEEIEASIEEPLNEAGLGSLAKTLKKKAGQTVTNVKNKVSNAIDKFIDKNMTREEKVEWVLNNALESDVKEVELDNDGNVIIDENDRKFDNFVIVSYKGYYSNGKIISASPSFNNKDLVIGKDVPEYRDSYNEAEELAKGWSMQEKNGPAFIYMVKGKSIEKAAYLCQFFKGELDAKQDKLEHYFSTVKQDLEGKAHVVKSGGESKDQGLQTAESLETPALSSIVETLENIDEVSLEKAISNSLMDSYKNVIGFRLTECSYLNETLNVLGNVFFESGNVRSLTYKFNTATTENDKAIFHGLNEKLEGKRFELIGKPNNERTFITESFIHIKKD
jgi:hypothetical protein